MFISKGTMLSGLCWIIQPFQSKSFLLVGENTMLSTHLRTFLHIWGTWPLCCFPRSALQARSLFCHGTRRWHKTSPYFLDEDWWGLTAICPVTSLSEDATGNICFICPWTSYDGNHPKWDFTERSGWTRKRLWERRPPGIFYLFYF